MEPLEPSGLGRVAGWLAIGCAIALAGYGLFARDWEPIAIAAILALCVFLAPFWFPGMFYNWVMKNRR